MEKPDGGALVIVTGGEKVSVRLAFLVRAGREPLSFAWFACCAVRFS